VPPARLKVPWSDAEPWLARASSAGGTSGTTVVITPLLALHRRPRSVYPCGRRSCSTAVYDANTIPVVRGSGQYRPSDRAGT
jgi:hypothetical protein